jgi:hypothetical protein
MTNYNLDISMYSFNEILNLFNVTNDIKLEDLRKAKLKVLSFHPDKNRNKYPIDFYFFYRKAFEIILNYYQEKSKVNKQIIDVEYNPYDENTNLNKKTNEIIKQKIKEEKNFNKNFNELFDKLKVVKDTENNWFVKEEPVFQIPENVNKGNMNSIFNNIKKQQNTSVVNYSGVQELYRNVGSNIYENSETYISCDIFDKLKYDDIKKVHRDQTVISTSEDDYKPIYSSIEHYNVLKEDINPLEKHKSEYLLQQKDKIYNDKIANLRHQSILKTAEYEEKNKLILSKFLHLK